MEKYTVKKSIYAYEFPNLNEEDLTRASFYNLLVLRFDLTEEKGEYENVVLLGDLVDLERFGKHYIGNYELSKDYLQEALIL